jgi:hypothetical protein
MFAPPFGRNQITNMRNRITNTRKDIVAYVRVSPPVLLGARKSLIDKPAVQCQPLNCRCWSSAACGSLLENLTSLPCVLSLRTTRGESVYSLDR